MPNDGSLRVTAGVLSTDASPVVVLCIDDEDETLMSSAQARRAAAMLIEAADKAEALSATAAGSVADIALLVAASAGSA